MKMSSTAIQTFEGEAEAAAGLLKSMANPSRLLVLCHLAADGDLSVGQLQDRIGLGQSALSQHLAKLREEGLVATRKEAQSVFYRVSDSRAQDILVLLQRLFCPDIRGDQ